eukprot:m.1548000 g.1548000  ORF g.1548000 m.1548000 type:complete len:187 (-) comp25262_c1_seq8:4531-5091(-)
MLVDGAQKPLWHSFESFAVDDLVFAGIVDMWTAHKKDVVFMETVHHLRYHPHTVVHAVPLEAEHGELAPMYFKKGIQDSDEQWSQHKKVIDTRSKGLRKSVPRGFPYFSVEFGMDGGFAHVIEDEQKFPKYFGHEILGNIVDVMPHTWLRPKKEQFETQKRKVVQFSRLWVQSPAALIPCAAIECM